MKKIIFLVIILVLVTVGIFLKQNKEIKNIFKDEKIDENSLITTIVEYFNRVELVNYVENGKENAKKYLSRKYDEIFEVVDVKYYGKGDTGFLPSPIPTGYSESIEIIVKDVKGNEYRVLTNGSLTDEAGINSCSDNIQSNQIKKAIEEKIINIFGDNGLNYRIKIKEYYNKKFEGDIIEFMSNLNEFSVFDISCIEYFYNNGNLNLADKDKEFLNCFNLAYFVKWNDAETYKSYLKENKTTKESEKLYIYSLTEYMPYINNIQIYKKNIGVQEYIPNITKTADIEYCIPFEAYEKINLKQNQALDISLWNEVFGKNVKVKQITNTYIAKPNYIYFIPIEKIDESKEYAIIYTDNKEYKMGYLNSRSIIGNIVEDYFYIKDVTNYLSSDNDVIWAIVEITQKY